MPKVGAAGDASIELKTESEGSEGSPPFTSRKAVREPDAPASTVASTLTRRKPVSVWVSTKLDSSVQTKLCAVSAQPPPKKNGSTPVSCRPGGSSPEKTIGWPG